VSCTCHRHGIELHTIRTTGPVHVWTEEELEWLRQHAKELTVPQLMKKFSMTYDAVRTILKRRGIEYKREKKPVTKAEQFKIMGLCEHYSREEIAKRIGRPLGTVHNLMVRLELHSYSGCYTQRRLVEETGYAISQLVRARDALGQKWNWTGKRYLISECQFERLMLYFRDPEAALAAVEAA